ncbi:MAG: hypothetical protein KDJ38_04235 [Gammaproteobacteria bacterium]|nr:hypothetical protein [Gammaproteobacteria bacterium]
MSGLRLLLGVLAVVASVSVRADIILMVHGYQGNADDWRHSGIVARLGKAGWQDGGVIFRAASSEVIFASEPIEAGKILFTAHLPSEYPLILQSQTLESYLQAIGERYPQEDIVLIGHSAGGVVARSALVRSSARLPVKQLITIASPHLGTQAAELGVLAAHSPLSMIAPMLGAGTLNRSGQLYKDLLPEKPGSLLFLLNRQQHPRIDYISLVRRKAYGLPGDLLVPEESQHLEYVYALRGLARSVVAGYGHALHAGDAEVILRVLDGPRSL